MDELTSARYEVNRADLVAAKAAMVEQWKREDAAVKAHRDAEMARFDQGLKDLDAVASGAARAETVRRTAEEDAILARAAEIRAARAAGEAVVEPVAPVVAEPVVEPVVPVAEAPVAA